MSRQRTAVHPVAVLAIAVCVLTACGQSTMPTERSIDVAARAQLRHDLHALAAALAGHRLARAHAALDSLDADAAAAHVAGKISATKFAQIRAAERRLNTDLERLTNRPAPTVTITSSAPAPADGGNGDDGKGHGDHGGDKGGAKGGAKGGGKGGAKGGKHG